MNKQEFITAINQDFKNIPSDFFNQIEKYKNFLVKNNKEFNLTKLDSNDLVYGKYFYESLIPYKDIKFNRNINVLDIGSGSGIPGILIKLMYPEINLVLIDSTQKKVKFLNDLINELKLTNVKAMCKRAEEIDISDIEMFDIVTSRAVARLKIILELSVQYAKEGGLIIEPKSKNYQQEELEANQIVDKLSLHKIKDIEFISKNNKFHHIFIYKKINKTNDKYPRKWKEIIK